MRITVHRKAHFNAAHRLFRKDWDDDRNLEVFGKCSNPHYHGHNYELDITIKGNPYWPKKTAKLAFATCPVPTFCPQIV